MIVPVVTEDWAVAISHRLVANELYPTGFARQFEYNLRVPWMNLFLDGVKIPLTKCQLYGLITVGLWPSQTLLIETIIDDGRLNGIARATTGQAITAVAFALSDDTTPTSSPSYVVSVEVTHSPIYKNQRTITIGVAGVTKTMMDDFVLEIERERDKKRPT